MQNNNANKMKRLFLTFCMAAFMMGANAQNAKVSGPDGKLSVEINVQNGKAAYAVDYDGIRVLEDSPLGFQANIGDYASGLQFVSSENYQVDKRYEMNRSKQAFCHYVANGLKVNVKNAKGQQFTICFQVSDNDIAFRYELKKHKEGVPEF